MVLMVSVVNKNGTHVLSTKLSAHSEGKASSEPRLPAFRSLPALHSLPALCPALNQMGHLEVLRCCQRAYSVHIV